MPSSVISAARKAGIPVTICESLDEVLDNTDVLYVTRRRSDSTTRWNGCRLRMHIEWTTLFLPEQRKI
jgi:hypothetical protein